MIKSSRKIVAGLLSIAMVLTLVVGLSVSTASAAYTRNLTVGSRGADVTDLQTTLAGAGFLTVSPTGYFGSLTQRALAQWQASVGISPASGYFGPITRAYLASNGSAGGVSTVPGCTAGAMYSTTTGQPCSTGSTSVPGCPAGAIYNYMTGALCATTGGSTSTTEGTLVLVNSAAVTTNANIQTNVDVPVWGVQLRAQLAPVTVSRIDLDVSDVISGGSSENPGNLINTIKVWDGSTLVKSWSVGTADFLTGTSSSDYYVRLSNLNFTVPANTTKDLVVSFSTNGGIDTARTVTIAGYGTNSLLAVSGNNINSYYNVSGYSFVQTFKKPGNATLTIGLDSANPVGTTNYLDATNGATGVTTLAWNAAATVGDAHITEVDVTVNSSGTAPSAVYLYDGATRIAGQGVSSSAQNIVFNNLNVVVPNGTTKVFTVKIDESSSATAGSAASTTVTKVYYQTANGNTNSVTTSITGNDQTFYGASANLSFLSGTATAGPANTSGQTQSLSGTFNLKVHPQGGQMTQPIASDFVVKVGTSLATATVVPAASTTISISPQPTGANPLSQGSDYTITLSAVAVRGLGALTGTGNYTFYLTSASTTVNSIQTTQTSGLDNFKTGSALLNY